MLAPRIPTFWERLEIRRIRVAEIPLEQNNISRFYLWYLIERSFASVQANHRPPSRADDKIEKQQTVTYEQTYDDSPPPPIPDIRLLDRPSNVECRRIASTMKIRSIGLRILIVFRCRRVDRYRYLQVTLPHSLTLSLGRPSTLTRTLLIALLLARNVSYINRLFFIMLHVAPYITRRVLNVYLFAFARCPRPMRLLSYLFP